MHYANGPLTPAHARYTLAHSLPERRRETITDGQSIPKTDRLRTREDAPMFLGVAIKHRPTLRHYEAARSDAVVISSATNRGGHARTESENCQRAVHRMKLFETNASRNLKDHNARHEPKRPQSFIVIDGQVRSRAQDCGPPRASGRFSSKVPPTARVRRPVLPPRAPYHCSSSV